MTTNPLEMDFLDRCSKVQQYARRLFERQPGWVDFFREIFGVEGAARKVFPTSDEYLRFEGTAEHEAITLWLLDLRRRSRRDRTSSTRVITIRLPDVVHQALLMQAEGHGISLNSLCLAKLLQGTTGVCPADELDPDSTR